VMSNIGTDYLISIPLFFQDLDVGAKKVKLYVDENLVFDGELERAC